MNTTIIIVSYKSELLIDKNINRLSAKHKIIIIDNARDKTLKRNLEKKFKNVRVILNKNNGFGQAANLGAKKSKTKYILFCSPDNFLEKKAIAKLEEFSKKLNDNFGLLILMEKEKLKKKIYEIKKPTGLLTFFTQRKVFLKLKGFDENFFLYYEDNDIMKRILLDNLKIYEVPVSFNAFKGSHNPKFNYEIELNRNWHLMWSKFYYFKKHYGYLVSLFITIPYFIRSLFRIILNFKNHKTRKIYLHRLLGLMNSYILNKSWFRPKI